MRKFSRSIQRRRAVLFAEAPGVVSADAAEAQRGEIRKTPEYKEAQRKIQRAALMRQKAELEKQLKTLEP